ncbi:MAG TPA: YceI family protein [Gemmatimonadaceae bacterium]|nr:YceI family protein [Gemmatimonadaceae bacterium]
MPRSISLVIAACVLAAPAGAQTKSRIPLRLSPQSELSLDGTSTMHGFTCRTSTIQAAIAVDSTYVPAHLETVESGLRRADVTIPVKSLTCGERKMDENMYKTLKADAFPDITYTLVDTQIVPGSQAGDSIAITVNGQLTIAGQTRPATLNVEVIRSPDGSATGRGGVEILMSDFGIKPPTFFLGRLKVHDRIAIRFDLSVSAPAVVAIGAP